MITNKKINWTANNLFKIFLVISLSVFAVCGCGVTPASNISSTATVSSSPIFTDPVLKVTQMQSQGATAELLNEAFLLNSKLKNTNVQIHMGYWSAGTNRAALMTLLDSINDEAASLQNPGNLAIWDEGVTTATSRQYPSYITMNLEYWYDRKNAVNNRVTISGIIYTDPYTVTLKQADDIWGGYSRRYADMAAYFYEATGKPVKAWCFVQGAYANRVFYTYELPELEILEAAGAVKVYFAKTQNADWKNSSDWTEGTANAPTPLPASSKSITSILER